MKHVWRPIVFFAASTAAVVAAEQSAAAGETSIGAAKRELDAIKAARNPAAAAGQKTELPLFETPELHLRNPTETALQKRERLSKEELEAARKSKNWLLDAMEKEKQLDEAARDGRKGRAELETDRLLSEQEELHGRKSELDADDPAAIAMREADAAKERNQPRESDARETPVSNPLADYMAGWMTPQDFTLLQPHLSATGAKDGGSAATGAVPMEHSITAPIGSASRGGEMLGSLFGEKSTSGAVPPAENPYLQSLMSPAQVEAFLAPPPPAMSSPAAPSYPPVFTPTPRQDESPTKSKIPDFAKPSDDDKYFKQLKRF